MPKTVYEVDNSQSVRAQDALVAAQKRYNDQIGESVKRLTSAEKEARRLSEQVNPLQRLERKFDDIVRAVAKGGLSLADAEKNAARLVHQYDRLTAIQGKAFGQSAFANFAKYTAGLTAATGAVSVIQNILSGAEQAATATAERIRASVDALGELQQLEGFTENTQFVKRLRREGVVSDASTGAKLAFDLDNAGLNEKDQEYLAFNLLKNRFIKGADAPGFALSVSKSQGLLGYGSFEEAAQKITQAAGSTSANIPILATATTKFASQAIAAGFTPDESLAAIEIADKGSANADAAADRLKSLSSKVYSEQLFQGSFLGTINAIKKRAAGGELLTDILGDQQAVAGYLLFDEDSEQARYRQSLQAIGTAPRRDVIGSRIGGLAKDPALSAAIAGQAAKGSREVLEEERFGERNLLVELVRERAYAADLNKYGEGAANLGGFLSGAAGVTLGRDALLRSALGSEKALGTVGDGGTLSAAEESRIEAYLRRTAEAAEATARSADRPTAGRQEP